MKNAIQLKPFTLSCLLFFLVYAFGHTQQVTNTLEKFIPLDTEIHQQIVAMDSIFFSAYNTCDLKKQATIYSDNLEFFHDYFKASHLQLKARNNIRKALLESRRYGTWNPVVYRSPINRHNRKHLNGGPNKKNLISLIKLFNKYIVS